LDKEHEKALKLQQKAHEGKSGGGVSGIVTRVENHRQKMTRGSDGKIPSSAKASSDMHSQMGKIGGKYTHYEQSLSLFNSQ
jgi:hypothetical protein